MSTRFHYAYDTRENIPMVVAVVVVSVFVFIWPTCRYRKRKTRVSRLDRMVDQIENPDAHRTEAAALEDKWFRVRESIFQAEPDLEDLDDEALDEVLATSRDPRLSRLSVINPGRRMSAHRLSRASVATSRSPSQAPVDWAPPGFSPMAAVQRRTLDRSRRSTTASAFAWPEPQPHQRSQSRGSTIMTDRGASFASSHRTRALSGVSLRQQPSVVGRLFGSSTRPSMSPDPGRFSSSGRGQPAQFTSAVPATGGGGAGSLPTPRRSRSLPRESVVQRVLSRKRSTVKREARDGSSAAPTAAVDSPRAAARPPLPLGPYGYQSRIASDHYAPLFSPASRRRM